MNPDTPSLSRPFLLAALVALAAGCGARASGDDADGVAVDGSTTVHGTIAGATVPTTSTVATVGPLVDTFGAFTSDGVTILISNVAGSCAIAQKHGNPPSRSALTIVVASPGPVVPGTYPISTTPPVASANIAAVVYETTDADCGTASTHPARAGSITLSAVGATTVDGAFEVTLDTGDVISGTFTAPVCDVSAAAEAGAPAACGT